MGLTKLILYCVFVFFVPSSHTFNATTISGSYNMDEVLQIEMDASSNIYSCGYFTGTSTIGPSSWDANAGETGFITKNTASLAQPIWTLFVNGTNTSNERITSIALDGSFIYFTGFTTANGNYLIRNMVLNNTNGENTGTFIAQLNSQDGTLNWAKHISAGFNCNVKSSDIDVSSTKVCVAGSYSGFDATVGGQVLPTTSTEDWVIGCYDASNGSHLWSLAFTGPGNNDLGRSLAITAAEDVVVVGTVESTLFLPPFSQNVTCNATCMLLVMLNGSDGSGLWFKLIQSSGTSVVTPWELSVETSGYIYVIGSSDGPFSVDFSTVHCSTGSDPFLLKFDLSGNLIWYKEFSNDGQQEGYALAIYGAEILVSGTYTTSTLDCGGGQIANSSSTGTWVASFATSDGAFRWSTGYPTNWNNTIRPNSIAAGPSGAYAVGGTFSGTVVVQSVTLSTGSSGDGFLLSDIGTTPSPTPSPSRSPSPSRTPSHTPSPSKSVSKSPSTTPTVSPSKSPTALAKLPSASTSITPSASITPSPSILPWEENDSLPKAAIAAVAGAGGGACLFVVVIVAVFWKRRHRRPPSQTASSVTVTDVMEMSDAEPPAAS